MLLRENVYIASNYQDINCSLDYDTDKNFECYLNKLCHFLKFKRSNRELKKENLKILLFNFRLNLDCKVYTSVYLNRDHYNQTGHRYKEAFYTFHVVSDVIAQLESKKLIRKIKGSY